MISQRTRGMQNTLLLCQTLLVLIALWVSMNVAFSLFTSASALHLDRYPIYGAVLILGLVAESLTRESQKRAANLFQRNIFDQHTVSVRQTVLSTGALFLYLVAAKDAFISRTVLALAVPLSYLVLLASNYFLPRFLARRIFSGGRTERALLIGKAARARRLQTWLERRKEYGFRAVGILGPAEESGVPGLPWLGECTEIERVLAEQVVTQVILLELPESSETHERLVEVLENNGIRILISSNLEEKLRHRTVHFQDAGLDFIAPREEPLEDPLNRVFKRLLDLAVALPVTVFVLPPLAIAVWILHRCQSRGPLLYRQTRAGLQNRRFTLVKFRTMHVNETESVQAFDGDSRIFPAGRWLRRMSLDEIPQFWNVLTGEMSICGPRPHLVQHNEDFAQRMAGYHVRTFVKPGITGLAQVRGFRGEIRGPEDIGHRLESDLEYLETWRPVLDVVIIFRTALQVLLFAGNGLLLRAVRPAKSAVAEMNLNSIATPVESAGAPLARAYVSESVRRNFRQILGIRFFTGGVSEAVSIGMKGGLVVAPSAPVLLGLEKDPVHRRAVWGSALAITDSGLMVSLWKLLTGEEIARVSGLAYLKLLLEQPQFRTPGASFWVMPGIETMHRNLTWLQRHGIPVTEDDCYVAPRYSRGGEPISDLDLVEAVNRKRPPHIIMAVGGGTQEKLGADLLHRIDYCPAIHCTGAAISFLSGEQVRIPAWADHCRLGWLFRCLSQPAKFVPRYWEARKLLSLMLEYHGRLPGADHPAKTDPKNGRPAIGHLLGGSADQIAQPL